MCMEEEERERERERERESERGGVERERYTSDPLLVVNHGPSGHHIVK